MMNNLPELPPYHKFVPKYLTYIPGRTVRRGYPGFKTHQQINHAKTAISHGISQYGYRKGSPHRMAIWEFDIETSAWVLIYDIAPGTLVADLPWKE